MKCNYCDNSAVGMVFNIPLCLRCLLESARLTQKIIDKLEESMEKSDQEEVEALEKRLFQKKG